MEPVLKLLMGEANCLVGCITDSCAQVSPGEAGIKVPGDCREFGSKGKSEDVYVSAFEDIEVKLFGSGCSVVVKGDFTVEFGPHPSVVSQ